MPICIENDFGQISLADLGRKMEQGYSVLKSPHVGNQHPSNLVCAALGVPLAMVTFTQGERDKNFHPHLQIVGGEGRLISDPKKWTPFANLGCGRALEEYHQSELKRRFPELSIRADHEMLYDNFALAEAALKSATAAISHLWYRSVNTDGDVTNFRGNIITSWDQVADHIFRFTNDTHGWLVPNLAHILFDLCLQSLESGRDLVYHLSGPQMVGYISKKENNLSKAYDKLRADYPEFGLPEVLIARIVPVASCRMVSHRDDTVGLDALENTLRWYENLPPDDRRYAGSQFQAIAMLFPEFIEPIENASCLSQYDIASADDLRLSEWMFETPLKRVRSLHQRFVSSAA